VIKLLIVEDSNTVQQALVGLFSAYPEIRVVGTAASGEEAVAAVTALRPDVITMDINMPGMDGFEATRAIMATQPTPIVIVTGMLDPKESATLFRVMEAGALMVTAKPLPPGHPGYEASARELVRVVKLMSEIKVVRRFFPRQPTGTPTPAATLPTAPAGQTPEIGIVAIGASTGGPPLLQDILSSLPADFALPVVIVQHMAHGFTESFAGWLGQNSRLKVMLAADGMPLLPGHAYVAPDGFQTEVAQGGRLRLSGGPPENGLRPAVAALFRSVARVYGSRAAVVLLSGMGKDGAEELKLLRGLGAVTIAQDRESSIVYGMPGEAVRLKAADYILPPQKITALLAMLAGRQRPKDAQQCK
jgi:two-component system, chemotaxis family, protein-glutamate methylesterase/glutaminase